MVEVKALQVCFIDNHLRQPGEVFEYNGTPNPAVCEIIEDEKPTRRPRKGKGVAAKKAEVDAERAADDSA